MICSISCLNKAFFASLLLSLMLVGCSAVTPGPPPLRIEAVQITQRGMAVEKTGRLDWTVTTSGAQGEATVELRSLKQNVESLESTGTTPKGSWIPNTPGEYRVKIIVHDQMGRSAVSAWSEPFSFAPIIRKESLIVILPIENLSDSRAPVNEIFTLLRTTMAAKGFRIMDDAVLAAFMEKHRVRYVGGLDNRIAQQLKTEAGVDGVFFTSIETWQESAAPRVSLISRLVMTGEQPEIVWIDSVGLTGEDSPGLLGTGRIKDSRQLLTKAFNRLIDSLQTYLTGEMPEYRHGVNTAELQLINSKRQTADDSQGAVKKLYQPQFSYRASNFDPSRKYSVAVLPFLNINARKHAGKIVALHMLKQLHRYANIRVFEPGIIRDTLLKYRMIMQAGPSLAASDVLYRDDILGADIIISGKVFTYQGNIGESKVDFSTQAFDGANREVIWASRSYAAGDSGVYFYNWGKIPSAHGLTSRMTQAVIRQLEE